MKFLLRWTSDQKNKGKNIINVLKFSPIFENIDHVAMGYCQYPCIVLGEVFFLASKIQFRNQSLTLFFFIKGTSVPHIVLMQISKITSSSQAGYSPPSNSFDNLNFEHYILQRNLKVIEGYCQLESIIQAFLMTSTLFRSNCSSSFQKKCYLGA